MARTRQKPPTSEAPPDYREELREADKLHTATGEKTYVGPIARHDVGSMLMDLLRCEDITRSLVNHLGAHLALRDDLRTIARLAAWVSITASYLSTRAALQAMQATGGESGPTPEPPDEEEFRLEELRGDS